MATDTAKANDYVFERPHAALTTVFDVKGMYDSAKKNGNSHLAQVQKNIGNLLQTCLAGKPDTITTDADGFEVAFGQVVVGLTKGILEDYTSEAEGWDSGHYVAAFSIISLIYKSMTAAKGFGIGLHSDNRMCLSLTWEDGVFGIYVTDDANGIAYDTVAEMAKKHSLPATKMILEAARRDMDDKKALSGPPPASNLIN